MLRDVSLTIEPGQRVLLAGPSGSGKSTLLRAFAGLLEAVDSGDLSGRASIGGHPINGRTPTGLMLQNPTAAVVAATAGRDVAFGPENLGLGRDEIWSRVDASLAAAAFPYGHERSTRSLSGGELQRLALAGALAVGDGVLLLDEPTSMLDDPAAARVREAVLAAIRDTGATTVIVEHHLDQWLAHVDRLIVLGRGGHLVADGHPDGVLREHGEALLRAGVWVPGHPAPHPIELPHDLARPWDDGHPWPPWLVRAEGLHVTRKSVLDRHAPSVQALADVTAEVSPGKVTVVTGTSGAGKSTLVEALAGLARPTRGSVTAHPHLAVGRRHEPWRWRGRDLTSRLAWVPQNPERAIVTTTVRDEVRASGVACGRTGPGLDERADGLLEVLGLAHLAAAHPYHLSGGEQRRLMVAAALTHGPAGLFTDEPTVGQDRLTWAAVVGCLASTAAAGGASVIATHDLGAARALGGIDVRLESGRVA